MKRASIFLLTLPAFALFCFGCTPAAMVIPSYIQNVGVDLFENRTSIFGLETTLTQATIRAFQVDGRVPLEDPTRSDLKVQVVIRRFIEEPLIYGLRNNQVFQYRLSIVYDLASVDNREKKTLSEDREKTVSIYYYTPEYSKGIPETREQALLRLADDFGRFVVRRVLEGH